MMRVPLPSRRSRSSTQSFPLTFAFVTDAKTSAEDDWKGPFDQGGLDAKNETLRVARCLRQFLGKEGWDKYDYIHI